MNNWETVLIIDISVNLIINFPLYWKRCLWFLTLKSNI